MLGFDFALRSSLRGRESLVLKLKQNFKLKDGRFFLLRFFDSKENSAIKT